MSKKVLITGASGMIGSILLDQCLASAKIAHVVSLVRRSSGKQHDKLEEVVWPDFKSYSGEESWLKDIDVVFFCLGVYTGAVDRGMFRTITVDYPVNLARAIHTKNPKATFCLLSGSGADRSEKSRMMFAKDKGEAENKLSRIGFKAFYAFRPAYIYPVEKRKEPNITYRLSRFLYPFVKLFGKNTSIKSTELANAMFEVGINGHIEEILENRDILNVLEQ